MAFQKNVRAVAGTIANGLREVTTSSTKRSLAVRSLCAI